MARKNDSSSDVDASSSVAREMSTPPSSPPSSDNHEKDTAKDVPVVSPEELALIEAEERRAQKANAVEEQRRIAAMRRKQKKKAESKAEREIKARELDELLRQSAAFSDILTKKTQVLGRVGSGFGGKVLGEHDLKMATQPKCMVGGTMRDYQLEGLTWMLEICLQNMSGILADEMGLGKTVQAISLIALLREQENYLGPHLIIAPLSTLSNWVNEFTRWTPSIPVVMYHGTPEQRKDLFKNGIQKNLAKGRPTDKFPVVCTSYEIILRDRADLSKINWEFIIIDEGHRMKNFDSKLFRELQTFRSATRFLITGTPLQNNLKELWSLLNFLMPNIFTDWEAFSSWFDFSELQDEEGTTEFIEDRAKQDLVKKIHLVLQPLLLRRIKADVASYLPKKREYILYAPMTRDQTDLYNAISDKDVDTRAYLESKVAEQLIKSAIPKPVAMPIRSSPRVTRTKKMDETEEVDMKAISTSKPKNAFALLMSKHRAVPEKVTKTRAAKGTKAAPATPVEKSQKAQKAQKVQKVLPLAKKGAKRKTSPTTEESVNKSAKSSRHSTPTASLRGRSQSRRRTTYREADVSDEDKMSDDEFEEALRDEFASEEGSAGEDKTAVTAEEKGEHEHMLLRAKRDLANKKLGNPLMQLRLVCNSPHNFYDPWQTVDKDGEEVELPVDERIVTASGKMLLLDRLLPSLFARGHKVLVFSQFKTQLDLLEAYCADLRGWSVCRIDGSVAHSDRQAQIDLFNGDPSYKLFLLSTRAGGQGINLASADTVILFDSDWNPQQDLQAQDRAHRIGQTRPVVVYRLATKGTVEEDLLMSADAKRRLEKLVIQKGTFRTMGQKMKTAGGGVAKGAAGAADTADAGNVLDEDILKTLLLKDGQVYQFSGGQEVLSDHDLDVLCDRSDEAYAKAASGQGDADGFRVIETGADGITESFKKTKKPSKP